MINVHLVFNAHLDPVWLWPWSAGLDEALATCRSACDRLDAHPDLIFTRGEAWVYSQIEEVDPDLFARIRALVQAGRWEIVGGWWIQPDCNLPSGFAMEEQIRLGKEYFESRFGTFPATAYNVDTFGHAAAMPRLMHKFGQTSYVMMRPQEHEMPLPTRLFRWQGEVDGPEVITFRIAGGYSTHDPDCSGHIRNALTDLPEGIKDTMCFVGVGDHGGGPTEAQIVWLKEHRDAFPECRLLFSSVSRFFDAIAPLTPTLPLVTGELQQHAVGCYTVHRAVKVGVRRAEHGLFQAQTMAAADPAHLLRGWEYTCFHQFHDTLGGTCLPSAYRAVENQLGYAQAVADEALTHAMRRRMSALPGCDEQRLVFWNASDSPFDGFVEAEPWMGWGGWQPEWQLRDEQGKQIVFQSIDSEAPSFGMLRALLHLSAEPGEMRVLRICKTPATDAPGETRAFRSPAVLGFGSAGGAIRLDLMDDPTDTWSHGIDRYAETGESVQWTALKALDDGPLMRSWMQQGLIGGSRIQAEWRTYAELECAELRLRVDWRETHKILKLVLPGTFAANRIDGTLGGKTPRANDGRELPLQNWTHLPTRDDGGMVKAIGIVCPDVFAGDAATDRVRLTLLRSAIMAHHDPHPPEGPRIVISDQGTHEFHFEFWTGDGAAPEKLDGRSLQLQRPPLFAELTRGMKPVIP